jgi:hypothetical protein
MINRRQFLERGSLLGAGSLLPTVSPVGLPAARGAGCLGCAVVDGRYAASRAFAHELQRSGVTVHVTAGDVTRVWFEQLQPMWRTSPTPVAGFTPFAALFCLERLGWDHDLRLVYRALHDAGERRGLEHRIAAGTRLRQQLRLALNAEPWAGRLAGALAASDSWDREAPITSSTPEMTLIARTASGGLPLYSWVIA